MNTAKPLNKITAAQVRDLLDELIQLNVPSRCIFEPYIHKLL